MYSRVRCNAHHIEAFFLRRSFAMRSTSILFISTMLAVTACQPLEESSDPIDMQRADNNEVGWDLDESESERDRGLPQEDGGPGDLLDLGTFPPDDAGHGDDLDQGTECMLRGSRLCDMIYIPRVPVHIYNEGANGSRSTAVNDMPADYYCGPRTVSYYDEDMEVRRECPGRPGDQTPPVPACACIVDPPRGETTAITVTVPDMGMTTRDVTLDCECHPVEPLVLELPLE